MSMKLFRLYPLAGDRDPRWRGRVNHGVVLVRAPSEADARETAAAADGANATSAESSEASAFMDTSLYGIAEARLHNYSLSGLRMVVSGSLAGLGWAFTRTRPLDVVAQIGAGKLD